MNKISGFLPCSAGMTAALYILFHSWADVPANNSSIFLLFTGLLLFTILPIYAFRKSPQILYITGFTIAMAVWMAP